MTSAVDGQTNQNVFKLISCNSTYFVLGRRYFLLLRHNANILHISPWDGEIFFITVHLCITKKHMYFFFSLTNSHLQTRSTPANPGWRWANCAPIVHLWDSQSQPDVILPGFETGTGVTPLALRCSASDPAPLGSPLLSWKMYHWWSTVDTNIPVSLPGPCCPGLKTDILDSKYYIVLYFITPSTLIQRVAWPKFD